MVTSNRDAVWWPLDYAGAAAVVATGIAKVNVVPLPISLSIQIRPPWSSMNRLASVSPRLHRA